MSTVAPWHTAGGDVYHIRDDCKYYSHILSELLIEGTAERQACMECMHALVVEQKPDRVRTLIRWIEHYQMHYGGQQ